MKKSHIKEALKILAMVLIILLFVAWIGFYFATCTPLSMRPIGELPAICLFLRK